MTESLTPTEHPPLELKAVQTNRRALDLIVGVLGAIGLVISVCVPWIGFHHTILDFHAFRQAQTALTAESMLHGGDFLHYQTPVLGAPWSMPFEFPLYQWLVANLARVLSTPLEETGRVVSIVFFYLCFFPLWSILSHIGLRGRGKIPPLAMFAVSPLYLFVSRTFMMESTALFFSLMYADQVFRLALGVHKRRWQHMVGAAAFGAVAGLVKVTTIAPYLALGAGLLALMAWRSRRGGRFEIRAITAAVLLAILVPVGAVWRWTSFADEVKAGNPITAKLTSHALSGWNYGTAAERLRPKLYGYLIRDSSNYLGSFVMPALLVAAWLWLRRRWEWKAVACALLYALPIAIFYNLYFVHEYYPYANAIFLLVGMGIMVTSLVEMPGFRAWVGVGILALQMAASGVRYWQHYYPIQSTNSPGRPQVAALIDGTTRPTDILLVIGDDWSSAIPYQTHRRAIMIPGLGSEIQPYAYVWENLPAVINKAGAENIGAFLACSTYRDDSHIPDLLREAAMRQPIVHHADDCDIYERGSN
jgi:hypothetical protein